MRRDVNCRASLSQSEEEDEVSQGHQHAGGGAGCSSRELTWRQRETRGVGRAVGCPALAGDTPTPSPGGLLPPTSPWCRGKRDPPLLTHGPPPALQGPAVLRVTAAAPGTLQSQGHLAAHPSRVLPSRERTVGSTCPGAGVPVGQRGIVGGDRVADFADVGFF